VDDGVLIDVLTRCNQLKYLDIENCRKISDKGVDGLVCSKRKLDSINIGGDYNITNTGLKKFVTSFPNLRDLRHLHVSGLDINDDIIYSIVDNCSDLTSLSISFADISEDALNTLLDKFGTKLIYYLSFIYPAWLIYVFEIGFAAMYLLTTLIQFFQYGALYKVVKSCF
jgi:hypothetical protein